MRQMLQGVVLHGTGRKALLEGYTSAGKTGTAQKVDPATGAYSKTKYVGSFAGFAPINNPQIAVVVILDSAVGLHQGGQVSAPVFQRIVQQVLEYQHVPHDVELPASRQLLLARRNVPDKSLEEISPDHLGATLDMAEAITDASETAPAAGQAIYATTAHQPPPSQPPRPRPLARKSCPPCCNNGHRRMKVRGGEPVFVASGRQTAKIMGGKTSCSTWKKAASKFRPFWAKTSAAR